MLEGDTTRKKHRYGWGGVGMGKEAARGRAAGLTASAAAHRYGGEATRHKQTQGPRGVLTDTGAEVGVRELAPSRPRAAVAGHMAVPTCAA